MFDFFIHISKVKHLSKIRFDVISTKNYLKNIRYNEKLFEGTHFKLSALVHENTNDPYFYKSEGISLFFLGNVFTNKKYATLSNSKPHRVQPAEIFQMYKEYGSSFINNLKGIFIILILDEISNNYQIFNSRNGLYDTYYLENNDCLIASSSLEAIIKFPDVKPEVDPINLIQHSIFDYPLGEKTLFKNVKILPPCSYLSYDLEKNSLFKYYDYLPSLRRKDPISWKETYYQSPAQFNDAVDLLINRKEKVCASLTSGFDSRTNLSRLYASGKEILYYSWGMTGSMEIEIPQLIAKKIGINYEPIYLENEFESSYDYFGKQAIMWSGGKGTIRRANHTYGYSKLFAHSNTIITGLFGSELLRPANAIGHIFNQAFIDVLYSDNQRSKLEELYDKEQTKGFLQQQLLDESKEDFISKTVEYFSNLEALGEKYLQLYYFTLTEGFRKYFGHEIHGCRPYVEILSPYIDDDFVEFILQSPVPDLNKKAFKRNPKSLKLGQSFYLPIIEKNFDKLMKIPTGRFYTPAQLKSAFFPLTIIPGYIKHRKKRNTNNTFDNHRWNKIFMERNRNTMNYNDEFLNPLNKINHLEINQIDLAKQLSLRYWLIECFKTDLV